MTFHKRARLALVICLALSVAACTNTPAAQPNQLSSATTAPPAPDYAHIPGQFPVPAATTDQGETQAPVGGCGNVEGIAEQSQLNIVDCSKPHAYIVIQRVTVPQECVEDADRYLHFRDTGQEWTACLDLAWDAAGCISLGMQITKVACDDAAAINRFKAANQLLNTTTVQGCPDGGYTHPIRRFAICTKPVS
ncbi:hypothetical protein QN239_32075 [Mycolicibacterium sp. Y3]